MGKKNCYSCGYRGTLPGSVHSRCKFNWSKGGLSMPRGKAHGIQNGWWIFPVNFDPIWMVGECKAHSEKEDLSMVINKYDPFIELLGILGGVGRL